MKYCKWCGKGISILGSNRQDYHKECMKQFKKDYFKMRNKRDRKKLRKDFQRFKRKNPTYWNEKIANYKKENPIYFKIIAYTNAHFKKEERCGLCNATKDLHFHHWRYRLPVQRKDISTLCRNCHEMIHHSLPKKSMIEGEDK